MDDDPFEFWSADMPPIDAQLPEPQELYRRVESENGDTKMIVFPSNEARHIAARTAGHFLALMECGFTRDEALAIVLKSMDSVIIYHHDEDDEDED